MDSLNIEDLKVGRVYYIEWEDCCAAGHFTSRLAEKRYDANERDYLAQLIFENGVTLECHALSGVGFRSADPEETR